MGGERSGLPCDDHERRITALETVVKTMTEDVHSVRADMRTIVVIAKWALGFVAMAGASVFGGFVIFTLQTVFS